jgi:hypothetical protein
MSTGVFQEWCWMWAAPTEPTTWLWSYVPLLLSVVAAQGEHDQHNHLLHALSSLFNLQPLPSCLSTVSHHCWCIVVTLSSTKLVNSPVSQPTARLFIDMYKPVFVQFSLQ